MVVGKIQENTKSTQTYAAKKTASFTNCIFEQQKPFEKSLPKNDFKQAPQNHQPPISLKDVKTLADVAVYTGLKKEYVDSLASQEDLQLKTYFTEKKIKDENTGEEKTIKILTIGYGHKVLPEDNIKEGDVITKERACKILAKDLNSKIDELEQLIDDTSNFTVGQKTALTDLLFQNGFGTLQDSFIVNTINEAKNNPKKLDEAVKGFASFTTYKGKPSPGICIRRLHNVYDYSSHKPTKYSFETMATIRDQGASSYDMQIEAIKLKNKDGKITPSQQDSINNILHQKELYLEESNGCIKDLKEKLPKPKQKTKVTKSQKQENSFWQQWKEIFFMTVSHGGTGL